MSDDLVERLRAEFEAGKCGGTYDPPHLDTGLYREAAEEIERMRAGLWEISQMIPEQSSAMARRILSGEKP